MSEYYIIDGEDDKSYKLYHKQHGEKSIPKSGLSKETMKIISGLPKLASGGKIKDPTEDIPEVPSELLSSQISSTDREEIRDYREPRGYSPERIAKIDELLSNKEYYPEGSRQRKELLIDRKAHSSSPKNEIIDAVSGFVSGETAKNKHIDKLLSNPSEYGLSPETEQKLKEQRYGSAAKIKEAAPSADVPRDVSLSDHAQAVPGIPSQPATPTLSGLYEDALKHTEAGIQAGYDAEIAKANAAQEIFNKGQQRLDNAISIYQKQRADLDTRSNMLMTQMVEGKVDPNKYWDNKSWGARIGAAFAVALSGFGAGILGQSGNTALEIINKEVERDIEAQKSQMEKTKNLLAINFERTKNLDQAVAQTRSDLLSSIEYKLKIAAAQSGSLDAKKNAEILRGELGLQRAKIHEARAKDEASKTLYGSSGQEGLNLGALPPETVQKIVKLPGGQYQVAYDADSAKKAREVLIGAKELQDISADYKKLMKEGTTWAGTKRRAEEEALGSRIILAIKNIGGLGVLSKDDKEIVTGMTPDPSSLMTDKQRVKLEKLNSFIQSKTNAALGSLLPNYKPVVNFEPGIIK